ncbi:ribosomal RNA small subunit methyltransferase A [Humisphaera borealis]|uniref:Ribosomal RNA small subunit methyltransferase A n=2 Tax=Humisphaera borealis TaxID=2807512 RepID=A0A7M2WQ51_9BACT|nr:ribosomal RNA small subunit methyltransferase A [Humisphaera borealis]
MIDQNLVRLVADAGELTPQDWCLEIGPGTGTLTEELLSRAGRVTAVEIDRDLAGLLRERLSGRENFQLIEGDALASKHELNADLRAALDAARRDGLRPKLVANLPYNIASPLVIELLIAGVDLLTFTVQKEVADRFKAQAGSDDYGPLTLMAQMLAKVEVLRNLPPQAFWPAPKIDSSLVRLRRDDRLGAGVKSFDVFMHKVFSFRRKTLRKAIDQAGYDADRIIRESGIDGSLRPEVFTPEQIVELWKIALPTRV